MKSHSKHEIKWYGWKPDLPDNRDLIYKIVRPEAELESVFLKDKYIIPSIVDQGALGSCHDSETEVLTDEGFKLFKDLTGEERLATINPDNGKLIFEKPVKIHRYVHKGKLHCVDNQSLNFKVTGNHKMLVRKWDESARTLGGKYELIEMQNIGWYVGLMNRVKWDGEGSEEYFVLKGVEHKQKPQRQDKKVPMSTWLRFLGVYLAEGTILKEDQQKGRISYKIQLAAFKDREKDFIRETLHDLGVSPLELHDRFTFENKRIYKALESLGLKGLKAKDKFVPKIVFQQNSSLIKEFILGHFMGDGTEQYGHTSHYTCSSKLANDLQVLIFLSGNETRLSVRKARQTVMSDGRVVNGKESEHRISVCENKNLSIERKSVFLEDYDGIVYCAEVPTYHTLVTRRNGKLLISGNCTGNGIARILNFAASNKLLKSKKQKPETCSPFSRLFIYYNERVIEGTINEDSGAMIRDGIKSVAKQGCCSEKNWKYIISKFKSKPTKTAYKEALKFQALQYERVDNTSRQALVDALKNGFPIVFGFSVYESFESPVVSRTGVLNLPKSNESLLGGHCVVCEGYDLKSDRFLIANSWGSDWGINGYFTMPAAYLTNKNLADDAWIIKQVE
jgi:hypothetical protein